MKEINIWLYLGVGSYKEGLKYFQAQYINVFFL